MLYSSPSMLPAGPPIEQAGHRGVPIRDARAAGALLLLQPPWACALSRCRRAHHSCTQHVPVITPQEGRVSALRPVQAAELHCILTQLPCRLGMFLNHRTCGLNCAESPHTQLWWCNDVQHACKTSLAGRTVHKTTSRCEDRTCRVS